MNEARAKRILDELQKQGVSQMLITDPMSICYLTGVSMMPIERFYALLLKADGHHVYFLNHLFHVPQEVGVEKVWYSDTDPVAEIVAKYLDKDAVLGVDKDLKARFLLPLMEMKAAAGFVNGSPAVDVTRGVKDAEEQEKMRVASDINDKAMAQFKALIHEGVTEQEVADQMLDIYLSLGAEGYSFPPLVAFGANAADPHHSPDNTVVKPGDCVLFDVGCIKDGYCSDMTRTFYFKTVSDEHRKVYETAKAANETAISKIHPGVEIRNLDKAARDLITDAGWGPNFTHRLGHFIGMSCHEFGDVSSANTWETKPGMIFSIEPGIYLIGDTGVRVEDLVLVTEDGVEVLNHYPKTLQIIE
ncbi:Xaa-Pro peptidase family protein [Ventrimonas sp. CLA-AP-H27]|uniref:Xaa-Pro peptidase family protein n=1 Tax=Ventrimonas faecis TaxID=3133170 RepID=A0ABV1HJH2_9FIRM